MRRIDLVEAKILHEREIERLEKQLKHAQTQLVELTGLLIHERDERAKLQEEIEILKFRSNSYVNRKTLM